LRDVVAIGFRRRRLIAYCFFGILLGTVLAVLFVPNQYEANMKILVKHERVDPVVTAEKSGVVGIFAPPAVTEEEMNSEVELIHSNDLLEQVVVACGLDRRSSPRSAWFPTPEALRIPKAIERLKGKLIVNPITKSDLIAVTYRDRDPQMAAAVLKTLGNLYLAKHLAVNRPPGEFEFFAQQADRYQKELQDAEQRLAGFGRDQGTVAAQAERDIALQKVSDLEAILRQTQAAAAAQTERISNLRAQIASTPPRLSTQARTSDNGQLLQNLKSTLLNLELKRTELLAKFAPGYRPVQEVEAQIAQTQERIAAEEKSPVREDTTDQNPTYLWLSEELAKAKAELPTLQASAASIEGSLRAYRERITLLDQKGFVQQDLSRSAKSAEESYLLYVNKREEARISDALDSKRISNVVIAEAATVPALPVNSPLLLMLLGGLLATSVSAGLAFTAEYFDPSFRTPDEVKQVLDVQVLAAIPKNGH
jgi:uncharacterized protein involved in exopolysaccharide biosynthesis